MAMYGPDMFGIDALIGLMAGFMIFFVIFGIIIGVSVYVYSSIALMTLAKRLKTGPSWLAWIPFANLALIAKMAKMDWKPVLLAIGLLIPFLNFFAAIALAVFTIIWMWKVCEARKKPGFWAVLVIIPFVGGIWALVMLGILAFGKK